MATDRLQEAARHEAERRYPPFLGDSEYNAMASDLQEAFEAGAAWAEQEVAATMALVREVVERVDFAECAICYQFSFHHDDDCPLGRLKALLAPEPGSTGQED